MVISTSALQKCAIGAAMLLGATVIPHNVLAQEITLESLDGKVNLIGQLVEFSDGTYKIKTSFGDFDWNQGRCLRQYIIPARPGGVRRRGRSFAIATARSVLGDRKILLAGRHGSFMCADCTIARY